MILFSFLRLIYPYLILAHSLQAFHFDRDDVALPGFHKFMLKQSDEEREHAQKVSLNEAMFVLCSRWLGLSYAIIFAVILD